MHRDQVRPHDLTHESHDDDTDELDASATIDDSSSEEQEASDEDEADEDEAAGAGRREPSRLAAAGPLTGVGVNDTDIKVRGWA